MQINRPKLEKYNPRLGSAIPVESQVMYEYIGICGNGD
jgi:hypothetical protein